MTAQLLNLDDYTASKPKRNQYSEAFSDFWKVCLRHMGRNGRCAGKADAYKVFRTICPAKVSAHDLGSAVLEYSRWCKSIDRHCMDVARFLRGEYETWLPEAEDKPTPAKPVAQSDLTGAIAEEWQRAAEWLVEHNEMPALWLQKITLQAIDHEGRPVLRCSTTFALSHIKANYERGMQRAWGREVVVR